MRRLPSMENADAFRQQDNPKAVPIFVLGLQRSGTTWLANMLCQHPKCAGIQAEDHHGIHESLFFSHFAKSYGDLADDQNYQRFAEDFAKSDYFLLSNLPYSWLIQQRSRSYSGIFRALMDQVAAREGASHWVEKSPHHTLVCNELAAQFPDAKFLCVLRKPVTLMPSLLNAPWRRATSYPRRLITLAGACLSYTLFAKTLRRFAERHPSATLVSYESLAANTSEEARAMCRFVELPCRCDIQEVPFKPNSSFAKGRDRSEALSALDRLYIQLTLALLSLMPLCALSAVDRLKNHFQGEPWPEWVWRRYPLGKQPPMVGA